MDVSFIPLDMDYVDDKSGVTWIRLFGKTNNGKSICVFDSCDSFFYLIPKAHVNLEKYAEGVKKVKVEIANRIGAVKKVEIVKKNFLGQEIKALKVYVENHKDIIPIKDIVKNFPETEEKEETDINFVTRYLLEKNLRPLVWHNVEGQELDKKELYVNDIEPPDVDILFKAKTIKLSDKQHDFFPKILAFDIESTEIEMGKGQVLMISVANDKIRKVFTWKHFNNAPSEVEFVKSERELIEKFKEIVQKEKPDFLVGYFSDGFDLPYLRDRADELKVKLDIGLDSGNITFVRGIVSSAKIPGIVHIDIFKFVENIISPTLQSETLTLNEVAKELVGDEKLKFDLNKINKEIQATKGKIADAEMRKYCLYNLQDSVLASKLFYQLWPNISELTKIVGEPLWVTSRSSYSGLVEHHIIHHLEPFNEIIKNRPVHEEIGKRRMKGKYAGAFVLEPKPGLYENLAVFDFRSIYPSVIVSFNISASTILNKPEKNAYVTPEFELDRKKVKFYFKKERGFFPEILLNLVTYRRKVKEELRKNRTPVLEARDYALKTLSNATYGYLGFFGARWYCRECAASTAATARYYLMRTIEDARKTGFNVIYGDTDSIMLDMTGKTQAEALKWHDKINKSLPGAMELELEAFYKRGIFVMTRKKEIGAKKKYALLGKDDRLKIRGFETVRRDWAKLTKELQDKVLRMILDEGKANNALKYVQQIIKDLKAKKIEKDKLVIRTQLKKEIEEYAAITPHVTIARRMQELGLPVKIGTLIEYIVTEEKHKKEGKGKGKALVRERAKLPEETSEKEYDADYYIDHQILPAVENIFEVFGISKEQILSKEQKRLVEF